MIHARTLQRFASSFRLSALIAISAALTQCSPAEGDHSQSAAMAGANQRSAVWLMTSLPIVWGENASIESTLSGATMPAPIYAHWQKHYAIEAVDSLEQLQKSDIDIVILAQPRAMDPADIAALDQWIRDGGRALILTDPLLVWPSDLPFGDKMRPLSTGLLSPLLDYWGLALQAPTEQQEGVVEMTFADFTIETVGIGTFAQRAESSPPDTRCRLGVEDLIAHCMIGQGKATLVADADFLHESLWTSSDKDHAPAPETVPAWVDQLIDELREETG